MLTIYDYALKRVIVLDDKAHSFHNISLYTLVASLQGMSVVDATFTPSKQALDGDQGARLIKLLRAFTPLSPEAVERIRASGYLPQTLSFGSGTATQTWTLQSATAVKAIYPMASSRRSPKLDMSDVQKAFGDAVGAVIAAGGAGAQGKRAQKDLRAAIEHALTTKHAFQALLLSYEMADQYGAASGGCAKTKPCHSFKAIEALAARDPRGAALRLAMHPGKAQLDASIAALKAMKRGDLSDAYMLDVFLARDLARAGRAQEALPLFAAALKANPHLPAFYAELGGFWMAHGEPTLAWDAYDLGRMVDPAAASPATSTINAYEAGLEKKYPELF
ncbi:MAG TPA: hypothetical protein VFV07_01725 [Rhizomicrobium sp.]|nr:hypothetical protein [Rhizomicrobium sp.]